MAVDGHRPRRHRRPRLGGDPAAAGLGGVGSRRDVHRPADRVPVLPQALPRRPPRGGYEAKKGRPPRTAWPTSPARTAAPAARGPSRASSTGCSRPTSARSRTSRACTTCARRPRRASSSTSPTSMTTRAQEAAVRHRPDRQELPQRDHAGQLHLPHPRVRADGDGVLRRAGHRRGVARVLARQPRGTGGTSTSASSGQPALLRAPEREAVALLEAHRRHRVPLRVPAAAEWGELEGIANRTDFDLTTHTEHSGTDLSYFDQDDKGERWTPYVIEPAAGLTRSLMAFLLEAYAEDEAPNTKGGVDKRTVLRLDPRLAPVKAAVLPLSRNADLSPKAPRPGRRAAQDLERRVRRRRGDRPALPPPGRDRHAVLHHRRLRHPRRPRGHRARARLDGPGAGGPRPGPAPPRGGEGGAGPRGARAPAGAKRPNPNPRDADAGREGGRRRSWGRGKQRAGRGRPHGRSATSGWQ